MRELLERVWKGRHDRHGIDDPDAPLGVGFDEALAAVPPRGRGVRLIRRRRVREARGELTRAASCGTRWRAVGEQRKRRRQDRRWRATGVAVRLAPYADRGG